MNPTATEPLFTKKRGALWASVLCLLVLFAQLALTAGALSPTYDEPIYTGIGYSDLSTGDVSWHGVIGHPPLINLLTAWPLLLDPERPDAQHFLEIDSWMDLYYTLIETPQELARTTLLTRLPVMWLTLLLAALVYRWAQQTWQGKAGLLALLWFVFDPHVLAHGQLNSTDMGICAFGFFGCYMLARHLKHPHWTTYLGAGIGLGTALATKASGLFWVGAYGLIVMAHWLTSPADKRTFKSLFQWGLKLCGWGGLAFLVLWASYLFEVRPLVNGTLPIPAASHWVGLPFIKSYMTEGQRTFLNGKFIDGGSWAYFPIALLVKTPIPTLIAFALALITIRKRTIPRWSILPLIIMPLAYIGVAIILALNIGHRHMLPTFPFAFIFISQLAGKSNSPQRNTTPWVYKGAALLLAGWYIIGTLWIAPYYLAYFNEFVGGPDNGYRYLADSSVDWGQNFIALKAYLEEHQIEDIKLAAFSSLDPAIYGIEFEPLPPTIIPVGSTGLVEKRIVPPPGTYVISAVPLQGIWLSDPDTYDWFRRQTPVAKIGHTLFVYEVPPMPNYEQVWLTQCQAIPNLIEPQQVDAEFGDRVIRNTLFDCANSWLYPQGHYGWTAIHPDAADDPWIQQRLTGVDVTFTQSEHWSHHAATIYQQNGIPQGSIPEEKTGYIAPSEWAPANAVAEATLATGPITTQGPLTFLGYSLQRQASRIEFYTYWKVKNLPGRQLSLMAHLLDANGVALSIKDGLGVPIETWQIGDIIVQRHQLDLPEAAVEPLYIQTGAYWLDSLERWPLLVDEQPLGDRFLLTVPSKP